jgi:hypothetical protein
MVLAIRLKDPNMSIEEYLKNGANVLREKQSPSQMIGDPKRVQVAGLQFIKQFMKVRENKSIYPVTMFVTKRGPFALQFIFRAADERALERLLPALKNLKLFP